MPTITTLRTALDRLLQAIVIVLMVAMLLVVVAGVVWRKAGASLVWYDEVASILLAWLTYYGAALAALKRGHIGFSGLVDAAPPELRMTLLVAASALVGVYLTEMRMPQTLAQAMLDLTENKYVVLALLNFFFLVIGLFLHSAAAIILVVPIVVPLIHQLGIDPVHFGIIVTLNLAIGRQTPPVASVLVTACSVARADIWSVTKVNLWFIAVLGAVLVLVTYVPMGLVELFYR